MHSPDVRFVVPFLIVGLALAVPAQQATVPPLPSRSPYRQMRPDTQTYMLMQAVNNNHGLEHSYQPKAYDLGTKNTQFSVAGDVT